MDLADRVCAASRRLTKQVSTLRFRVPVTHVYNPLEYAARSHNVYVRSYATSPKQVLFLGMNPGPYGMAQTGVPFGEVGLVRDWLGIEEPVRRPKREHPKRPVEGFACSRSEVSGRRLWGTIAEHFRTPERFFERHYVANYCPLVFMEESGRNRTPDKLPAQERDPLFEACDEHLAKLIELLQPKWVIGLGAFATRRAECVVTTSVTPAAPRVASVLHPSPANPRANKDWAGIVRSQLAELGLCESC